MKRRIRIQPGYLFAVPFDENRIAIGIVLHVSRYFRNAVMVGFYRQFFSSTDTVSLDVLSGSFIWPPNYTGKQEITDGKWSIITHSQELLSSVVIPYLAVAEDLFLKDEYIRKISDEEHSMYQSLVVSGGGVIESRLRAYFSSTPSRE